MGTPRTIAITGLGTFLGQHLAERFLAADVEHRVVGFDLRKPLRLEGRMSFHRLDLTDPLADARLAEKLVDEEVDTVVHTAFRRFPSSDVEYDHELETLGSLHLMNACAAAKVKRLVVESSTMLYGPRPDNPNFLAETQPLRGHAGAHCVQNRVEMEELLVDWRERHPEIEVSVLRHCWVMGPSWYDYVVEYFERSTVPALLGYDPLLQFIHEFDLLNAMERAALESHPGIFNVVGRGVLPLSTLLGLAGKRMLSLPPPLLHRVAYVPTQGQAGDSPEGFFDYLRYLWIADGEKGWKAFGEPVYSTKEAWVAFVSSRRMRRYR